MSLRAGLVSMVLALGVVSPVVLAPAADAATKPAACVATVSNARPTQNSTVTVSVGKVGAAAAVTTVAQYKTTKTTKKATADRTGRAAVAYKIGPATHGFKVVINVTAAKGSSSWACSTSFVTR